MIRVALYIRVSTDEQALHGDSIETQKDSLKNYAKNNNMDIVDYYVDDGYTATNLKRPNLERLLNDVETGLLDLVLFTKIDRWSRGVRNYYKIQDLLDRNNVHWKTIFENYDTSTASGRLHINIMLSVAENESAQTSERIKAVFKNKLSRGEVCSGKIPRGYKIKDKKLVIDEEVAPMIRDIYNFYESTNSLQKLVEYVKDNYAHIHYLTLKRILTNPLYIGNHRCDSAETNNFCEALIRKEQFDNVQRILKINVKKYKSNHTAPPFIFSGLLVCKDCGHRLTGNRQVKENKKVGKYYYSTYRCIHHYKEKLCINNYHCPEINILEKYLLDNIKKDLETHLSNFKSGKVIRKKINTENIIASTQKKIELLRDLYLDELISKEDYKEKYETLNSKLGKAKEKEDPEIDINAEHLENFLKLDFKAVYADLNNVEKRRLWMSIVDRIVIGKDRSIEMVFVQ